MRRAPGPSRLFPAAATIAAVAALCVTHASAQDRGGTPAVSPALEKLLAEPYLTDRERLSLRVDHGLWTTEDLKSPAVRARAALIAGAYLDPVFDDPAADALDRAEAMLLRGRPGETLKLLGDASGLRAGRLRASALFDLGRFADADAAVQPVIDMMASRQITDADTLVEGVRALMIRATIRGSAREHGGDFHAIKGLIEHARDDLDRLSWRARLAEAELLYDKHNPQESAAAATEALTLNPRCAGAQALLARIAVDSFAFDEAERLAIALDSMGAEFGVINPDAAEIRARMRLRQRDAEGAETVITPARKALPDNRRLLALDAAIAAVAFDDERLEARLTRFDRLSPGSPMALYEVGRALAEARQYDDAIETLRRASGRLEHWPQPWIEQGLVLIQAGRDDEAEPVLERAVALDPFNTRAKNSLELVRGLKAFTTIESEHFRVRFEPGIDELLAREMRPVLEKIHVRVCADPERVPGGIGFEPARKTTIELMPSHRWFAVRITGMTRVHTMAAATGPVIAMERPQDAPGLTVGPFDWPRVIQHEYTHTVTLGRTRNRIPHWFTEAAAVFNEDAPRDEQTWRLLARAYKASTLFDLDEINIAFVRPKKPTDRGLAYAQGHWMYQFIIDRWGPTSPVRLMDRYAAGEPEASAFEAELGVTKDDFSKAFRAWAGEDLRRVGLLLPEDVPSIVEMLKADRRGADDPDAIRPDEAFIERWSSRYPRHPELIELRVARRLEGLDENQPRLDAETVADLRLLAEVMPIAEQPNRLLARHFLAGETPAEAIPYLEFLDAREQHSAVYAAELARLYAENENDPAAMTKAERASRIAPFDADIRELAARVALKTALDGDTSAFTAAERHIKALTVIEPGVQRHKLRLERVRELASEHARAGG